MDSAITFTTYAQEVNFEGETRIFELTWVKVNPACRTVPEVPLEFYVLKVTDETGAWLLA